MHILVKIRQKLKDWFLPKFNCKQITESEYLADFNLDGASARQDDAERSQPASSKAENALKHALDIRKFEIELYWKRATYFWTFIGATFAGYGAVQSLKDERTATDLSVLLSCFGFVLSFGWFCANKGSKQWQENWENHVDMLEDSHIGPLYKIVLRRPEAQKKAKKIEEFITGPGSYSVSKINQLISLYVTVLWVLLLARALPAIRFSAPFSLLYSTAIASSVFVCLLFLTLGRTHGGSYTHRAFRRSSRISLPDRNPESDAPSGTLDLAIKPESGRDDGQRAD